MSSAEPKPDEEHPVDDNDDDNSIDDKYIKFEDIVDKDANGQAWIFKSYRKTRDPEIGDASPPRPVVRPSELWSHNCPRPHSK